MGSTDDHALRNLLRKGDCVMIKYQGMTQAPDWLRARNISVVIVAISIIVGIYSWSGAGQTAPSASPTTATYKDLSDVYDAIASSGYDSSAIASDSNGGAFEIAKCIIEKIKGGTCP